MLSVAVVQVGSTMFDTAATLNRAITWVRRAAEQGARLIVLPEALLGGYPKGLDFGVRVGSRDPAGRREFQRYWDAAIDVPGPQTHALSELARELGVTLIIGAVERVGRTLHCVALLISPDHTEPLIHRKLMPTAAERVIWGTGDGSTMPVLPLHTQGSGSTAGDVWGVGSAICWENYMPLFRAAMYAKGVDIWCAPTVDDRDSWLATMRHIAVEGRCFVLSACQYLEREGLPPDVHPIQGDVPGTVLISGGSVIVSPFGEVLAGPLREGEGMLAARLDLRQLAQARMDLDVIGHYARPDIFQLTVDERPRVAVRRHIGVGQRETGAFLGERAGHAEPDALGTPGDEHGSSC
ncbi:carbon-nitrogen hydrolase family protein [Nonomuraea deserti]|uniref:Carbon-nitrogen hydrolase family protein n=2 Tax=Nonomuraea deserti TaxID=1848322 RepID=A0A4R4V410_9ACTN|nr:carbon-nitrogen hydrolase family protein [Nonomuraea deserti]